MTAKPIRSTDRRTTTTEEPIRSTDRRITTTAEPVGSTDRRTTTTAEPIRSTDIRTTTTAEPSKSTVIKNNTGIRTTRSPTKKAKGAYERSRCFIYTSIKYQILHIFYPLDQREDRLCRNRFVFILSISDTHGIR